MSMLPHFTHYPPSHLATHHPTYPFFVDNPTEKQHQSECYCGGILPTDIDTRALPSDSCDMACTGNTHVLCGGRDAITIYELKISTDGGSSDNDSKTDGTTYEVTDGNRDGGDSGGRIGGWSEGCFADKKGDRVLDASYVYKNHQMTHRVSEPSIFSQGLNI